MAAQQSPLSKEALVQFNESTEAGVLASQRRRVSISTRRSSQSRDHQQFAVSTMLQHALHRIYLLHITAMVIFSVQTKVKEI